MFLTKPNKCPNIYERECMYVFNIQEYSNKKYQNVRNSLR